MEEMASEARKISSGGALLGPNDAETTLVRAAAARLCLAALAERYGTLGGLGPSCPDGAGQGCCWQLCARPPSNARGHTCYRAFPCRLSA